MVRPDWKRRYHALTAARVWTREIKYLDRDFVPDMTKSDMRVSITRDGLYCTYVAMCYDADTSANYYIP
ncbi:MAG: hypothetical protein AB7O38_31235 [Pirellulaceae bacterium]